MEHAAISGNHAFLFEFKSMKERRVVITGMGLISPLSLTLDGFWEALQSGRSGVRPFAWEDGSPALISHAAPALFSGHIEEFDATDAGQKKAIKKATKLMSREIQMAVAASCRALKNADIQIGQFPADRVGISFGSDYILTTVDEILDGIKACCRKSPDGKTFRFSDWAEFGMPKMQPLWQLKYLPNMPSSHIAILNNFHGPNNSMTLKEASVGAVVGESVEIIKSGRADLMLAGTTGSRIHPLRMIAASQQEVLAPEKCCPFDKDRQGTILGDGAGALVLEELEHAEKRGATIWGEVVGASYRVRYARDRSDQRREVLRSVMSHALRQAGMESAEIGHVNAHGLGNKSSDLAEALAIDDVFGPYGGQHDGRHSNGREQPIPVTAAKGFFGNLGAGTGTIELIASVLSLTKGNLFPVLNCSTLDPDCPISLCVNSSTSGGKSFIKTAVNLQGQASAIVIRKV